MAMLLTAEEDQLFNFLLGSAAPQVLDAVSSGSTPDLVALDRLAAAFDRLRRGIAEGRLQCSVEPSEADVEAARRLVDLVRAGAPQEEIAAVARSVLDTLTPRSLPALTGSLPVCRSELVGHNLPVFAREAIRHQERPPGLAAGLRAGYLS